MTGSIWRGLLAAAFVWAMSAPVAQAEEGGADPEATGSIQRGPSGLPLPRFVSLKSGRVNVRTGPGLNYAVEWLYLKAGLPMEILQEYDNWRRVRDSEGAEGWVNQSLLSGKRTAIVAPWQKGKEINVNLLSEPDEKSSVVAILEPGVVGKIKTCNGLWCEATFDGNSGWVRQTLIWGAYPDEQVGE
ncbi:MAG: SH3 domain-containing protein [Rhizobiaceae bacterium]|nr:SH3 domain-containing protein [Rhizobiaceae bacterium]